MYANRFFKVCAFAAIFIALSFMVIGPATAQEPVPDKPLKFIVPFGTGGGTDLTARLVAPELQKELGVPVQVINKPGGGGWVAWHEMANWASDDWMIGYLNQPHVFAYLNPKLKRPETLDSWNFFLLHTVDPGLIVVKSDDERFPDLEAFLNYAKENKVVVAAHGVGGDDFIGVKQVEKKFPEIKLKMVHNDSDAKSISQLVGGHVDAIFGNVAAYTPQILEGKFRPLCVNWMERVKFLPSVPTFEEAAGTRVIHYAGRTVVGPKGMPEEREKAVVDAFKKAVKHPDYKLKMMNSYLAVDIMTGERLQNFLSESKQMVQDIAYWKESE